MTHKDFIERFKFNKTTDKLGEGGFGKVFKAYDNDLDRWVAIKIAEVKHTELRLKKEVEMVKDLPVHRNVARYEECYTFDLADGEYDFGILQYYSKGNLLQLLKENELSQKQKTDILIQILAGLDFLHQNGIIHRDLKPQNILMVRREDGTYIPKITDFGISKKLDINKSSVFNNSLVGAGTLAYSSPEQLNERNIRKNADIWSFGVIAFQVFTGELPFTTGSHASTSEAGRMELFRQINRGQLPDSSNKISETWRGLIERCLVVDPEERIRNCEDCVAILKGSYNKADNITQVNATEKDINDETKVEVPKSKTSVNQCSHSEQEYNTIKSSSKTAFRWYVECLKQYINFQGRAGKKEFWSFFLFNILIILALIMFGFIIDICVSTYIASDCIYFQSPYFFLIPFIYNILTLCPSLAVSIRRLHDTGRSGWWILLNVIPLLGNVAFWIFMLLNSQPEINKWDINSDEEYLEKSKKKKKIVIGIALIICIGCVYSISLDRYQALQNDRYGYRNGLGVLVIPCQYDSANAFREGLADVSLNGKYGYINTSGDIVIPLKYDFGGYFRDGLAWVKLNEKYGYIDKAGNTAISLIYDEADDFSDGRARVKQNDKYGYISKSGNAIIAIKYDDIQRYLDNLTYAKLNDKYGYIDESGNTIIPFKYDDAREFTYTSTAKVQIDGKWGLIDRADNIIIPCQYDNIEPFLYEDTDLIAVKLNGKWGYVDKNNTLVIPFNYDYAYNFYEGTAYVGIYIGTDDSSFFYIDRMENKYTDRNEAKQAAKKLSK